MIYLAYDGSLNGDWVSRYGIRLAAHTAEKKLTLVHIQDNSVSPVQVVEKINNIEQECNAQGIEICRKILPLKKNVFQSLLNAIPHGSESFVVCGTRIRSKRQAFLFGTISEKLLESNKFNVLAVRVVQPGLLANPRKFLIPLAGHPRGFKSAWPFFKLFLPEVEEVYLLRVMNVSSFQLLHFSPHRMQVLRKKGLKYLADVIQDIKQGCGADSFRLDYRVVVSNDWSREILDHGCKLKTRMILFGASERTLLGRTVYGNSLERVLRGTPCDMGIYRGI
ncbi:MAG: universal stress protein [Proteobacteria bacterium]|nr:universal stress protein [Pseudomonadota bacterium]MBU4259689.1 universal stress protein [Pseudomonadota bacterium]MBU4289358.1 universal stress protein [Pseudomonadota bacterium]MBU4414500.1 universal stress protein [Pseudomonadota bacterium]MCG2757846.1 universal stress protein [Desulfobacteraceae bacterium]